MNKKRKKGFSEIESILATTKIKRPIFGDFLTKFSPVDGFESHHVRFILHRLYCSIIRFINNIFYFYDRIIISSQLPSNQKWAVYSLIGFVLYKPNFPSNPVTMTVCFVLKKVSFPFSFIVVE